MFKRNDLKKLSVVFDCEEKNVKDALHAATKYLSSSPVNSYSVARSMSILADKLSKAKKNEPEINYPNFGMRSDAIKKYRRTIIDLYYDNYNDLNFGYGSIAKHLKDEHRVIVSRQTVKTYIDKFEKWRS